MGISPGQCRFADGLILYFGYQNTADVCQEWLFDTLDQIDDPQALLVDKPCHCGQAEPVELAVYYGGDFHWPATACRHCRVITSHFDPYETPMQDGLPEWWIPFE